MTVGAFGANGLAFPDLAENRWLQRIPATWPAWDLKRSAGRGGGARLVNADHAMISLTPSGMLRLTRQERQAVMTVPDPGDDVPLIHPYLTSLAVIAAFWSGEHAMHAGAFISGDKTWIVLGSRGDGKSTLLACAHLLGLDVLCDDLVIVRDGQVMVGPRCIDLRQGSAEALDVGAQLMRAGVRRWRADLPEAPVSARATGVLTLGWTDGPDVIVDEVGLEATTAALAAHEAVVTDLSTPDWEPLATTLDSVHIRRPRDLDNLLAGTGRVLERLDERPSSR